MDEAEKARVDAKRYRWLKKVAPETLACVGWRFKGACLYSKEELDDLLDAAMASKEEKRGD